MHSMQPRTSKRATFAAVVWIVVTACLVGWAGYLLVSRLMSNLS